MTTGKIVKMFLCDVPGCEKLFSRNETLKEHMRRHNGDKAVQCDYCKQTFFTSDQKYKHTESVHKHVVYKCNVCDKKFNNKRNLEGHVRIHNEDRQFQCDKCFSYFTQNSDLKKHVRTHSDAEPYTCDVCSASFKWQNSLSRHKKIHTKERPHKCETCDTSFIQKCDLKKHTLMHAKTTISCNICKEEFSRKDSLNRHYKTHRSVIQCPISGCGERFKSKQSLLLHLGSSHIRSEVDSVTTISYSFLDHLQEENQEDVDDPDQPPDISCFPSISDSFLMNGTSCSTDSFVINRASFIDNPDHFVDSQSPGVFVDHPSLMLLQDQEDTEIAERGTLVALDYVIDNDTRFVIAE